MKSRKRIALLMGQPEENCQQQFVEGFLKQVFGYDYDVCIFSMYLKYQETELREIGESNIFNLIQYDKFDAIVLLIDTIQTPGVANKLVGRIKKVYDKPVLCVDKEVDGFVSVMTNHYYSEKKLIEHLIEKHGFKDIAFLTGKRWHPHSAQRLQAYRDCMAEHGLEIGKNRIFYGDFWYGSGANTAEALLEDRDNLPEAIACANDYMAIGIADVFSRHGIRIPEDIAVIGYDLTEEGKNSPMPLTSCAIPVYPMGVHVAKTIHALIGNEELPEYKPDIDLFIGSSCGCNSEVAAESHLREKWASDDTECSFYSMFNHMLEDLLSGISFDNIMDTIQGYTYQIREFDSFYMCLNDTWINNTYQTITEGYTERILPVLICGPSGKGEDKLNFDKTFDVREMLPELYAERDLPKAFFFTPIHFDDVCFGYAVISYGNATKSFDDVYYMWLRNVMMGLECYRRIETIRHRNEFIEESKISDELTGVFNYKGFIKHAKPMIERARYQHRFISVIAIDVIGMEKINKRFGRKKGDYIISELAKVIKEAAGEGGICCRLGNDEFIIAQISEYANKSKIKEIGDRFKVLFDKKKKENKELFDFQVAKGGCTERVDNMGDMERLVNAAVSRKNGNKTKKFQMKLGSKLTEDELNEAKIVGQILDENLFSYHFQPIVDAKDGSIYAYEALMRAQVTPYISPLVIIKYATHLERLYDVERATFFNVLKFVDDKQDLFAGRKVFINSILGIQLNDDDIVVLKDKMAKHSDYVVVELTEKMEADDETLADMKNILQGLGVETAVDDYGTGYSNVVNLLRYMPDYVKIDRMLLSDIQNNVQKQHFVKDIIIFAHDNNFKVLAEGIETSEELETVISLGIDLIQGYYTAKPNPEIIPYIPKEISDEIKYYHDRAYA